MAADETIDTSDRAWPRDEAPVLWLVISASDGVRAVQLPSERRITLGRSPECDVVIADDSVSRRHAAITPSSGGLLIEDLGSRNQTRVGALKLTRGETAALAVGVVAEIGHATVAIHRGCPLRLEPTPSRPTHASAVAPVVLHDPTMTRLFAMLHVIAPSRLNVLILGETGTGKEVFAEAVHAGSDRAGKPFLKVNCSALTGSLLESELFGHEKGAFTGASAARAGIFESADGGTVFLDEVGELPPDTQAKLLRVIEYGEVTRLGSVRPKRVDVRYVAATNRELEQCIGAGRFRADLFYRLNGFAVTLPPLRDRPLDILPLARHLLHRAANGRPHALTPAAEEALKRYAWPGNVRELKNVIERALVLAGPTGVVDGPGLLLPKSVPSPNPLPRTSEAPRDAYALAITPPSGIESLSASEDRIVLERQRIEQALAQTSGNQTEAAKLLGVSRRTLINKIEAHGIARPRKR
jgi:two-component system response regulator AtoC